MDAFDDILEPPLDEQVNELKKKVRKYIKECSELETELDLANKRTIRQAEIQQAIDMIDRLKEKISDKEWTECLEANNKKFAEVDLTNTIKVS